MRTSALLYLGALARLAHSATFDIDAGEKGFAYVPNTITAAIGDIVNVHFYPGPHDFTQSSFDNPCSPLAGGVNSGTVSSSSGQASKMFTMKITSTDPMWFYCGTPGHCAAGMSMVINPPASGDTLKAYQSASSGKAGSNSNTVSGGQLVANVDNDDDDGDSSSSAASQTGTATSTGTATAATTTSPSGSPTSAGSSPQATTSSNAGSYGSSSGSSHFGVLPLMFVAPAAAYYFS